ncbi:alkaline phosphatase PafA [Limibacter armeniacum]|uniref:alkaline phosphatase PafA n=1 Tax=Limibacter armeniacum TaxID=466084 RepID=UPI002FE6789D
MRNLIKPFLAIGLALMATSTFAQNSKPKLIVGIMVDQMRYDYLERFRYNYGDGGFKELTDNGFVCRNGHYDYAATATGPGHISVYSGTYPAHHGIVGNSFFDRSQDHTVYCVSDDNYNTVGADSKGGKMSPHRVQVSTLTDEIKLASNMRSKVISISLKDRSSVLPAGHIADGAFWLDDATGNWISSTFYMDKLPEWVEKANKERKVDEYMKSVWEPALPLEKYEASLKDNNPYEGKFKGEEAPVFPHDLDKIDKSNRVAKSVGKRYSMIKSTPFGNTMVKDMAKKAIEAEGLGKDDITDLLAISFSSTDYVGHQYGPTAIETEDTYIKLDRDLADLISYLDKEVGEGNYLIFLSADHAGANVPAYMESLKVPAGYFDSKAVTERLDQYLDQEYGEADWIKSHHSAKVYLNREAIKEKKIDLAEIQEKVADKLVEEPEIKDALTGKQLEKYDYSRDYKMLIQNAYNRQNSPDVYGILHSNYMDYSRTGTSHGTPYAYDTHVPILFYGWRVKAGETVKRQTITEIAPTVSAFLHINMPSGCYSNPIEVPLK